MSDKDISKLGTAASRWGAVEVLPPTEHCGIIWTSDGEAFERETNAGAAWGWTRNRNCGMCGAKLGPLGDVALLAGTKCGMPIEGGCVCTLPYAHEGECA
jgi:hypothetical protein